MKSATCFSMALLSAAISATAIGAHEIEGLPADWSDTRVEVLHRKEACLSALDFVEFGILRGFNLQEFSQILETGMDPAHVEEYADTVIPLLESTYLSISGLGFEIPDRGQHAEVARRLTRSLCNGPIGRNYKHGLCEVGGECR